MQVLLAEAETVPDADWVNIFNTEWPTSGVYSSARQMVLSSTQGVFFGSFVIYYLIICHLKHIV